MDSFLFPFFFFLKILPKFNDNPWFFRMGTDFLTLDSLQVTSTLDCLQVTQKPCRTDLGRTIMLFQENTGSVFFKRPHISAPWLRNSCYRADWTKLMGKIRLQSTYLVPCGLCVFCVDSHIVWKSRIFVSSFINLMTDLSFCLGLQTVQYICSTLSCWLLLHKELERDCLASMLAQRRRISLDRGSFSDL